ncbi:hypothetical protein BSKO_03233 [Bryopsis sp. KO-2023]|nr:hypothetical protein BSKO_03233 [Bryopsis sp. KO-2023]
MPLHLDTKRVFSQRSDRVKGVDLHPTEPWLLACLYSGHVYVWNYSDGTLAKTFEATDLPVRAAKFVARKQWVVCGADDMFVRVFNYNTMDKVKTFEAHTDYIRSIGVHPNLPYVLTSSDDMLIKLWDWERGWQCTQIFEGHAHYVMQVVFNPKDTNTFASASLDRTVKVWSVGQPMPNFTLEGHEKGVNSVDYFTGGDRPYLISGADDKTVRVWDYQTKGCVQVLEGHSHNISAVCFHPELPIIISGSEDGTVKIWHSTTFRLEDTVSEGKERVWAIGYMKGQNGIAVGYDEGILMLKLGREEPLASMDSSGKIIWAKHNEIQTTNLKSLPQDYTIADGERIPLAVKDLGSTDSYPHYLSHNPNGRFVAVCGDGEYIIYTALAWRNKSFGQADEFVWGADASEYAIREGRSKVKLFRNFSEKHALKMTFSPQSIFGGALLAVLGHDFIVFYDWGEGRIVRKIDVEVKKVIWSDSGDLVALTTEDSFFILQFQRDLVDQVFSSGQAIDEDGIDDAFEVVCEISEQVVTALWVGDCFLYNNSSWRLNYCVGGEVTTLYHLDKPQYLMGYLATQSRIYLVDKEFGVTSYTLLLNLIEYKTLVMRGEMDAATDLLSSIPEDQMNTVARFLESRDLVREALEVATDPDYRFELAVQLGDLPVAHEIAKTVDSEVKWKQLGELAMSSGKLTLAEDCLKRGRDLSGLLLLCSARGSRSSMKELAEMAKTGGKNNIAFMCHLLLGETDQCIDILVEGGRMPEAAFFARTYAPAQMSRVVKLWRDDLKKINPKAAESLADPEEYPNLFPDLELALQAETMCRRRSLADIPASRFPQFEGTNAVDLIEELKKSKIEGEEEEVPDENGDLDESGYENGIPADASETPQDGDPQEGAPTSQDPPGFDTEDLDISEEQVSGDVDVDDWGLDDE